MQLSDKELIEQCLAKKQGAYKQLYEKYSGWLYAVAMRYCQDRDDAQDILQDSFIAIFGHLDQFNLDLNFPAWIKKITVNTALGVHRKKNAAVYQFPVRDVEQMEILDLSLLEDLDLEGLQTMIGQLSPGRQQIFNLYFIEGYAHKEIAEMLQISEGTSKSQLYDAKKELRRILEQNNVVIETKKL